MCGVWFSNLSDVLLCVDGVGLLMKGGMVYGRWCGGRFSILVGLVVFLVVGYLCDFMICITS